MTTEQMPAFIEEANLLYATDPAGAVAMLYEGTRKLKERMPETVDFKKKAREQRSERERQLMLLESAHRLMGDLLEDVNDGILPDPLEWELDVGVAQDIVRLTMKHGF